MITLYQEELDELLERGCQAPGCECNKKSGMHSFFLHSKCHTSAGLTIAYREGMLLVGCGECGRPVAHIAVASKRDFLADD